MASQVPGKAIRQNLYGTRVDRAAATIPATTSQTLFTVAGGRVLITTIIGEVTTVIQAQANAMKLQHAATAGGTSDMCATVESNGKAVGALFGIPGAPASAATFGAAVPQTNELVVGPGSIQLNTAATNTGAMKWTLTYIPLDDGASVTAA